MGNTPSHLKYSFYVTRVSNMDLPLVPFVHLIVACDGSPIGDISPLKLKEILKTRDLNLEILDLVLACRFKLTVPKFKEGQEQKLGINIIKIKAIPFIHKVQVLAVKESAENDLKIGDNIIGVEGEYAENEDELICSIKENENVSIVVVVVRNAKVITMPISNRELGCEVGLGLNYSVKQEELFMEGYTGCIKKGEVIVTQEKVDAETSESVSSDKISRSGVEGKIASESVPNKKISGSNLQAEYSNNDLQAEPSSNDAQTMPSLDIVKDAQTGLSNNHIEAVSFSNVAEASLSSTPSEDDRVAYAAPIFIKEEETSSSDVSEIAENIMAVESQESVSPAPAIEQFSMDDGKPTISQNLPALLPKEPTEQENMPLPAQAAIFSADPLKTSRFISIDNSREAVQSESGKHLPTHQNMDSTYSEADVTALKEKLYKHEIQEIPESKSMINLETVSKSKIPLPSTIIPPPRVPGPLEKRTLSYVYNPTSIIKDALKGSIPEIPRPFSMPAKDLAKSFADKHLNHSTIIQADHHVLDNASTQPDYVVDRSSENLQSLPATAQSLPIDFIQANDNLKNINKMPATEQIQSSTSHTSVHSENINTMQLPNENYLPGNAVTPSMPRSDTEVFSENINKLPPSHSIGASPVGHPAQALVTSEELENNKSHIDNINRIYNEAKVPSELQFFEGEKKNKEETVTVKGTELVYKDDFTADGRLKDEIFEEKKAANESKETEVEESSKKDLQSLFGDDDDDLLPFESPKKGMEL